MNLDQLESHLKIVSNFQPYLELKEWFWVAQWGSILVGGIAFAFLLVNLMCIKRRDLTFIAYGLVFLVITEIFIVEHQKELNYRSNWEANRGFESIDKLHNYLHGSDTKPVINIKEIESLLRHGHSIVNQARELERNLKLLGTSKSSINPIIENDVLSMVSTYSNHGGV